MHCRENQMKRIKGEVVTGLLVFWGLVAAGGFAAAKSDSVAKRAETAPVVQVAQAK